MTRKGTHTNTQNPEWATLSQRISWLVFFRYAGNRTAMARAVGYSHTVIADIVRGVGKAPGRRLLEAIVSRLGVDPAWLQTGQGQPFATDPGTELGIPVTSQMLPGMPLQHQDMITHGWLVVPEITPSPGRYWLRLDKTQPIVKRDSNGFRVGDLLLMETDPSKFPKESAFWTDWCIVRTGTDLRLAQVNYHGPTAEESDWLEADFPTEPKPDQEMVEHTYRHWPDGTIEHHEHRVNKDVRFHNDLTVPVILFTDIVAVWLKILRRP